MRKYNFEENINWAAGHMFNGYYYGLYRNGNLKLFELNDMCQEYRQHRFKLFQERRWYQFSLKKADLRLLNDLDKLLKDIYRAQVFNHKIDLSKYGVKQ